MTQNKILTRKLWWASALVLLAVASVIVGRLSGCGQLQPTRKVIVETAPQSPPPTPVDPPPGPTPPDPVPPPAPQPPNPPGPTPPGPKPSCDTVTTFAQLQPVLSLNCAGCHPQRDTYAIAKDKIDPMIARVGLLKTDALHMPAGRDPLPPADQALFTGWKHDGFLKGEDCTASTPPVPTFHDFPWIEQTLDGDINRQAIIDQPNTRWLLADDAVNFTGASISKQAASKALNMVSTERGSFPVTEIAPGIWRINIDDVGIQAAEWQVIENASQLQLESFTNTGANLKLLTSAAVCKTKPTDAACIKTRLPWMNVSDFVNTVLQNSQVYYRVTESPATLNELFAKLGVNFAGDLANDKAQLIGFKGSNLAPQGHRLITRNLSTDGVIYGTFDTGVVVRDLQNIVSHPLLKEAGGSGKANLDFAAGEWLYTLPNGLMGSFLADKNGKRLDQADPAVVHDFTTNPNSPTIINAVSCTNCHAGGFLRNVDIVRSSVNGSGLDPRDIPIVLALYKPQGVVDSNFSADNANFADALRKVGVDATQPDPIAIINTKYLSDQKLQFVADQLHLTPAQLTDCINQSPQGKTEIGDLNVGNSVSHSQVVLAIAALKRDCRLFQNPLSLK